MSYRRHTPINHEKRTPLEGVLSVSQDRISRQVREPFFPTQPKRTMGRGLARGGERLRCHRPLSLSRFPIRVSTINKFVLYSQFPPPRPFLFYLFILLQDTQPSRRSRPCRPGNHGVLSFRLCLFTIIVIIVSLRGEPPCKCLCLSMARLLALSNCCQHFQTVPV